MNKEEKAGRKAGRQTRTERETETHRLRDREYQRDTENRGGRRIKGESPKAKNGKTRIDLKREMKEQ